jgi:hypothetical protein
LFYLQHLTKRQPIVILFGVCLLVVVLGGCGMVPSAQWYAFKDSFNMGSDVQPEEGLVSLKGILRVAITKAADPEWKEGADLKYPYAGIMMKYWKSGKSVDFSGSKGLEITYRLQGSVSLKLIQAGMPNGREFRVKLSEQEQFGSKFIPWERFSQPPWIHEKIDLDLRAMVGLMLVNSAKEQSTAYLSVKEITFPGWKNPDSFFGQLGRLGKMIN